MNGKKDDKHKQTYCTVLNHADILSEVDSRMKDGNIKYGDNNWRYLDECRIKEALARHLLAYLSGEITDPECKSHTTHLSAIISNAMFLYYFYKKELKSKDEKIKETDIESHGYWSIRSKIVPHKEYEEADKFHSDSMIDDNEGSEID